MATVALTHFDDDGAYIQMTFDVTTDATNLRKGFDAVSSVCTQLEETAIGEHRTKRDHASRKSLREFLAGERNHLLDLVIAVETALNSDEKGRSLEELSSRLFESVDWIRR